MKVAIVGATGYGGVELIRILRHHPEVEVHSVHSSSKQGNAMTDTYPHLFDETNLILEDIDPVRMASEVDVVFTATPSGISAGLTPKLLQAGAKVIDLSGDYRLKDPNDYKVWYKKTPGPIDVIEKAVYGLPEWMNEEIKHANLIANPGCYPTATLLGLAPLVKNNLIEEDSIIIDAKSGVTGAGRSPSPITHFSETNENFRIYKVNQHQHIPEIEQTLKGWNEFVGPVTFSTHLVPMTRGIMATIYGKAKNKVTAEELHQLFKETYDIHPFVRVRDLGAFPATKEVYASNFCDIGIAYDERTERIMVVSVIDNLMKGAAGQAVQNLNLLLGLDETKGLEFLPTFP